MIFRDTPVEGVYIVEVEPYIGPRGVFARTFCQEEFEAQGLDPRVSQCNLSHNPYRGTLRGLHYQSEPHGEVKLVRCVTGAIFDVAVDLRPGSPTYLRHAAIVLSAENRRALYIPKGCAHGFQTLEDDSGVLYQMSDPYAPDHRSGVRWDDPAFGIDWPISNPFMIDRDANYPDYRVSEYARTHR
jgi:dTDP-4-dehydrorhamnose 3,5-epimerase